VGGRERGGGGEGETAKAESIGGQDPQASRKKKREGGRRLGSHRKVLLSGRKGLGKVRKGGGHNKRGSERTKGRAANPSDRGQKIET